MYTLSAAGRLKAYIINPIIDTINSIDIMLMILSANFIFLLLYLNAYRLNATIPANIKVMTNVKINILSLQSIYYTPYL